MSSLFDSRRRRVVLGKVFEMPDDFEPLDAYLTPTDDADAETGA